MSRFVFVMVLLVIFTGLLVVLFSRAAAQTEASQTIAAAPVDSAFTYQGHLTDDGAPATGAYDLRFRLYNSASGRTQVGPTLTLEDVEIIDGMFTVALDFGPTFDGGARWLEMDVRVGSSSDAYTTLAPRQALTAAPYALSLRPGAVISGALGSDATLSLHNSASLGHALLASSRESSALRVVEAGVHGLSVFNAGGNGAYVFTAGDDGYAANIAGGNGFSVVSAGENGLLIEEAGDPVLKTTSPGPDGVEVGGTSGNGIYLGAIGNDGVVVENAVGDGLQVNFAGGNGVYLPDTDDVGVYVGSAGQDGILVDSAGADGLRVKSAGADGLRVKSAGGTGVAVFSAGVNGVFVDSADFNGLHVSEAGDTGVAVFSAGVDGVYVKSAGDDGIDVAGDDLAGYFDGDIQITGSCTGCLLATFGVNTGDQPLEPGDVVTVQGVQPGGVDSVPVLMQVSRAAAGQPVVGVVGGRAELRTEAEPRPGEIGRQLIPREGAAGPGAYVTIIIYGPVQVRASDAAGTITPGARLAVGERGQARRLKTVQVDGVPLAESTPVIGLALSEPGAGGLVWVLVNPQ